MRHRFEVTERGVQSLEQRFGKRRRTDHDDLPQLYPWRCNLTSLSQQHNLYFVACKSDIYVYEPDFPQQTLREPLLIIPGQSGSDEDAINALLVECLGDEEVVSTVHDNGDVRVFLVRHLLNAIRSRRQARSISKHADELRPLFQDNVGMSAWGIAIHTNARVIAVSCNAHTVTVFKFGLVRQGDDEPGAAPTRETDVVQQIINGYTNIPAVAFCNTGDDPEARWLLTTDINGECRTIDLHGSSVNQIFRFGRPAPSDHTFDRLNAGWTIMFLDQRSFNEEVSMSDALGLQANDMLPDANDNPLIWDISLTIKGVPGVSSLFKHHNALQTASDDEIALLHQDSVSDDSDVDMSSDDLVTDEEDFVASSDPTPSSMVESDTNEGQTGQWLYSGQRIYGNMPRLARTVPFCDNLSCPVLHGSVHNIYLIQPTNNTEKWRPPFVGIASPLHQSIQREHFVLNVFDRLNLSAYIPALGIVVLASQKGRAIVLALTKLGRSVQYPYNDLFNLNTTTNFAMRVEAILPFESQEKLEQRPFAPLHGIAAGPMQGSEHQSDEKKRWRLLLMYQDHSVLSYEISRKRLDNVDVVI